MSTRTFGEFKIDLVASSLSRNGIRIRLSQKPFRLLEYFTRHAGRTIGNAELVKEFWAGNQKGGETNVHQAIRQIRKALRDTASPHSYLITEPGEGYRFIADVRSGGDAKQIDGSPHPQMSFPQFRDIEHKHFQEITLAEHPLPWSPTTNTSAPFSLKPVGEVDYVDGWNVRLQAGTRYQLKYHFGKNEAWPEIEVVLYQRVPFTDLSSGLWKRVVSAGAVTSETPASDVTPQSEDWPITCWGKTSCAWDKPWLALIPETKELDAGDNRLTLYFSPPAGYEGEGGSSTLPATAGPRSAVHMQAMA